MVALKGAAIEAFVARPDPAQPIVVLFGPDAGLVAERTRRVVAASVDDVNDPFALVQLEGDALAADPPRLFDEARTVPLFGGRRAILVRAQQRDLGAVIEPLAELALPDCRVVIEAGDLRRGTALRTLAERSPRVAALPCYGDSERDLHRLTDDELRAAGLTISDEARAALLPLLGADRRTSLSELRKLALYAAGQSRVELADVLAVIADAATLTLELVVDAGFAGKTAELELQYNRAKASGMAPGRILSAALNQAAQLHRARLEIEAGGRLAEVVDKLVGKAHFRRRAAIETALKLWTAARLGGELAELAAAATQGRKLTGPTAATLGDVIAARALLLLAVRARARARP